MAITAAASPRSMVCGLVGKQVIASLLFFSDLRRTSRIKIGRKMMKVAILGAFLTATFFAGQANAQVSGTAVLPITNVSGSCIDGKSQQATIFIKSIHARKEKGWFTEDKSVGARVDLTIDTGNEKISYPAAKTLSIKYYNSDIVRMYLNLKISSSIKLKSKNDEVYSSISLPMFIVHKSGKTEASRIFDALENVTKSNPTVSGFLSSTGVKPFTDIVFNLFNSAKIQNPDEIVDPEFSPDFAISDGQCTDKFGVNLRDDLMAFIADYKAESPQNGVIKTSDISKYCFYTTTGDDPIIKYVNKSTSGECQQNIPTDATDLHNPQIILVTVATPEKKAPANVISIPLSPPGDINRIVPVDPKNFSVLARKLGAAKSSIDQTVGALNSSVDRADRIKSLFQSDNILHTPTSAALRAAQICQKYNISTVGCL